MVKLSVIVPFYNVQTYAPDTLRSLRANIREDFEFILVDDCSTDGTADLLRRAQEDIPGAVVHRHERNGGLATARNTGLDRARGSTSPSWTATTGWPQGISPNCSPEPSRWAATSSAPITSRWSVRTVRYAVSRTDDAAR